MSTAQTPLQAVVMPAQHVNLVACIHEMIDARHRSVDSRFSKGDLA
jgi:hypothetical protein